MPKQTGEFGRNWYAVHTYAGYEDAVARNLRQRVESMGMEDKIFNVVVPTEKRIVIKSGKRKTIEDKIYPGYVLIDMVVTDDSWYVVRNTPRVTGFVGAGVIPTPLEQEEVDILLERMGEAEPRHKISVQKGDAVRISDGPFKEMEGKVEEVDEERGKIKVLVSLFGRETPVELDPLQIFLGCLTQRAPTRTEKNNFIQR
jgi:transcription termination/antitermination protein NusG